MERSPAASTAVAIADAVKSLVEPTHEQDCFSSAVCTDGNPYGIHEGLICSMPCWSEVRQCTQDPHIETLTPIIGYWTVSWCLLQGGQRFSLF